MFPKFVAASIQAAPVFLNSRATAEKACQLIRSAAAKGAKLIALPEVFLPGYPYWNWIMFPLEGGAWFRRLYSNAVTIDGDEVREIRRAAQETGTTVVIGINERSAVSMGTLYNTNLLIGPTGEILGAHRKLVPTFAEKLTWGSGDGSSIAVHGTDIGRIGTLACGENTNTLARYALLAQGEQIHVCELHRIPICTRLRHDRCDPHSRGRSFLRGKDLHDRIVLDDL